MDVMQLKTLQDWVVERRLRMVPGVSDVLVLGGKTKEFQAEIDLNRMRAFGVSIPQIINALATNNANVGDMLKAAALISPRPVHAPLDLPDLLLSVSCRW